MYYCDKCGQFVDTEVQKRTETLNVRGVNITLRDVDTRVCKTCGSTVFDHELDEDSLKRFYREYERRFPPRMRSSYSIGDTVVIRDWDDMVEEYGEIAGRIVIGEDNISFVPSMSSWCGREMTIKSIAYRDGHPRLIFEEDMGGWKFSPGMVRPVDDVPEPDPEQWARIAF